MELSTFHVIFTVVLFVIFVGIVIWAFSSRRRKAFREAAQLPFTGEEPEAKNDTGTRREESRNE